MDSKEQTVNSVMQKELYNFLREVGYTNSLKEFDAELNKVVTRWLPNSIQASMLYIDSAEQYFKKEEFKNKEMNSNVTPLSLKVWIFNRLVEEFGLQQKYYIKAKDSSRLLPDLNPNMDYILFPVYDQEICISLLLISSETEIILSTVKKEFYSDFLRKVQPWIKRLLLDREMLLEKERKDILIKVSHTFHTSHSVGLILGEIFDSLNEFYPSFRIELHLSHDWDVRENIEVKKIDFRDGMDRDLFAEQSFVTGSLQIISKKELGSTLVYVPLKGKQGVYGILKLESPTQRNFPENELDFIQVLAEAGGNAIENADLYAQSRNHIEELQLINNTSQQLNKNLKLDEIMDYLFSRMKHAFSADEAGFILFNYHSFKKTTFLKWSQPSLCLENKEGWIDPYVLKILETQDEIFINDWHAKKEDAPYQSLLAVPMIHQKEITGIVFLFAKEKNSFSFTAFKLFQKLIHHSTLAFVNAMLHEEMAQLITIDHLTKLRTRKYLDEIVEDSFTRNSRGSFILIDIDHFKKVNDQYGHQTGDEVLVQVSNILIEKCKNNDCVPIRWGGEELAIYCPDEDIEEATRAAYFIKETIKVQTDPKVTVSIGISEWSNRLDHPNLTTLFAKADEAMYVAKEKGRDRVIRADQISL